MSKNRFECNAREDEDKIKNAKWKRKPCDNEEEKGCQMPMSRTKQVEKQETGKQMSRIGRCVGFGR